jgi:hypothetical protein
MGPRANSFARRAPARDEVRHARAMARLAKSFGAAPARVHHVVAPVRSLEAIAVENAVEACVGETYGALLAAWQAAHARDPAVRDVLASIAPDELSHAALGWAVHAWAEARLDASAQARVRAAREHAVEILLQGLGSEPPAEVAAVAGLPRPRDAIALALSLSASVWGDPGFAACAPTGAVGRVS